MKTQTIVLALALVAVTPAVLSAQDYVGGPGSKIGYIADSTLNKIRQNNKQKQEQTKTDDTQKAKPNTQNYTNQTYYVYAGREGHMMALENLGRKKNNKSKKAKKQENTPSVTSSSGISTTSYYPYAGREGHMMALENLGKKKENKPQTKTTPANNPTANTPATTHRVSTNYNPYVGPEGHRAAIGNAVRDARRDSTPAVPNHVRDLDTVATNHRVTLNSKQSDKSAKKTNNTFVQYLQLVGKAIADEAPYMK